MAEDKKASAGNTAPEAKELTPVQAREKAADTIEKLFQQHKDNKFFSHGSKGQTLRTQMTDLALAARSLKGEDGKEPGPKLVEDFYEKLDTLRTHITNISKYKDPSKDTPDPSDPTPTKPIHPKGVEAANVMLEVLKKAENTAKTAPGLERPKKREAAEPDMGKEMKNAMSKIPLLQQAAAMLSNQQTHDHNSIQLAQTGRGNAESRDNGGRSGSLVS